MIDMDAARAARREANSEGPVIKWAGEEYELPVELPYECLEALRGLGEPATAPAALVGFAEALLGERYEEFRNSDPAPSMDDLNEMIGGVMKEYGVKRPLESSAS